MPRRRSCHWLLALAARRLRSGSGGEVGLVGAEIAAPALGLLPVLLPAQGGEVEEVVRAAGRLEAPRVLGVGVEHAAVDVQETTTAGHLERLLAVEEAMVAPSL